ncbi:MAG: PA0069 family radical SAM protein [Planctomycetales bacterium]|nr:PA0069 family radical SAM protein [Planctomycetales bacterium]
MRHGSHIDPPNRFHTVHCEPDVEHLEWDQEHLRSLTERRIEYLTDDSQSIVSENKSPDIPFRYSLNPYRGCAHACAYCYARVSHEYLGFNAGLDFETKIVVKHEAPNLLRKFLGRKAWQPQPITFSGVTDCYQPAERRFQLTRQCLNIAAEFRQPVSIVTKNALVVRDLDILQRLAQDHLLHVFLSITTLAPQLARDMEPRTSIPAARLRAVELLAQAGVPVGVMLAPLIPGLNDAEIPQILQAAKQAGARTANYILLRLPLTVEPVFREWLQRTQPRQAEKVLGRVQNTRGGKMSSSVWGERMRGRGAIADQIQALFRVLRKKQQLDQPLPPHDCTRFRPPPPQSGQMLLF